MPPEQPEQNKISEITEELLQQVRIERRPLNIRFKGVGIVEDCLILNVDFPGGQVRVGYAKTGSGAVTNKSVWVSLDQIEYIVLKEPLRGIMSREEVRRELGDIFQEGLLAEILIDVNGSPEPVIAKVTRVTAEELVFSPVDSSGVIDNENTMPLKSVLWVERLDPFEVIAPENSKPS